MDIRNAMLRNATLFRRVMNLYPPFLGAGIRVRSVSADFREVVADLHSNRLNRNAFGTHFGGSLYAMTDPFYALMLAANLGQDYVVWDRAAHVDFVKPGKGTVTARFVLTPQQLDEVRSATAGGAKFEPVYPVEVRDAADVLVARVTKTLYVRKKPAK